MEAVSYILQGIHFINVGHALGVILLTMQSVPDTVTHLSECRVRSQAAQGYRKSTRIHLPICLGIKYRIVRNPAQRSAVLGACLVIRGLRLMTPVMPQRADYWGGCHITGSCVVRCCNICIKFFPFSFFAFSRRGECSPFFRRSNRDIKVAMPKKHPPLCTYKN